MGGEINDIRGEDKERAAATEARTDFPDNTFAVTISNNCLSENLSSIHRVSSAVNYLSLFLCPLSLIDLWFLLSNKLSSSKHKCMSLAESFVLRDPTLQICTPGKVIRYKV